MPPRSRPLAFGLVCCALALAPRAASAQGVSLELRVQRAIERGVAFLVREQKPDGTWPGDEGTHPGGQSSLVALTLVKSGLARDDPHLRDALAALRPVVFKSTYSASVYLMLRAALIDKSKTEAPGEARDCFQFLLDHQQDGLWAYPQGAIDMSNTQFALLGLRAGTQLGFEVPEKAVESCLQALFRWQRPDGSFAYESDRVPTGSMTAATLGGLAVLAEMGQRSERVGALFAKHRADVARGEAWMEQHLVPEHNPYGERFWTTSWHLAHLWAIERWCGLTNRAKVGTHDWYREIAAWLVEEQQADGSWSYAGSPALLDTCFALLFLRRSTISAPFELGETWKKLDAEKAAQAALPRLVPEAGIAYATDWLVCGPLHDKPGLPQFLDPSALHLDKLHARERLKFEGEEFVRLALKPDGWTDLDELTKRQMDQGECLLACVLGWEPGKAAGPEPLRALLWLTLEDGVKIWLDGKPIGESLRTQSAIEEYLRLELALAPGTHELLVLLADDRGAAAFAARFSDERGKPLPAGFTLAAEPPRSAKKR